jgi:hypothetical protein
MKYTEVFHPEQTVNGVRFQVVELVWKDGGRSFDVYRTEGLGLMLLLTEGWSFDNYPTDEQIFGMHLSYQPPDPNRKITPVRNFIYMCDVVDGQRVRLADDEPFYTVRNPHPGQQSGTVYTAEYADGTTVDSWADPSLMVELAE